MCLFVAFLLVSRQSASCGIAALQLPTLMHIIGHQFYPAGTVSTADQVQLSRLAARLLQVRSKPRLCSLS